MKHKHRFDSWVEALGDKELPVLPGSLERVEAILRDDEFAMRELAQVILQDVGLALSVIRMANAVPHRHFHSEITTCEDAVMMLGTETLRRHLQQSPKLQELIQEPVRVWYLRLAAQASYASMLARTWAQLRHDMVPTEVALAALLYPLGELMLATFDQRCTGAYLELAQNAQVLPHEAEYVALGINLEQLGFELAEHWRLPSMARECMRARNAKHLRSLGVMLAFRLAREAMHGWVHPLLASDIRLAADYLDIQRNDLIESLNAVSTAFNEHLDLYQQAPVPLLDEEQVEYLLSKGFGPTNPVFCLAPRKDLLDSFEAQLSGEELDSKEAVINTLTLALHHGLGLNRVVYARISREGDALVAQRLEGTDHEPAFNRFHWPLLNDYLMGQLLKRPTPFWLNASNREGLWPQIPDSVRRLIGVRAFFLHSVFIHGRVDGVVYADRRYQQCALDKKTAAAFRHLVLLAMQRLEQLTPVEEISAQ